MERLEVDSEALPRQVAGTVTAAASYWCVCVCGQPREQHCLPLLFWAAPAL